MSDKVRAAIEKREKALAAASKKAKAKKDESGAEGKS